MKTGIKKSPNAQCVSRLSAVNDIYTLKGQWNEANKAGDIKKKIVSCFRVIFLLKSNIFRAFVQIIVHEKNKKSIDIR